MTNNSKPASNPGGTTPPIAESVITEEQIEQLVHAFYDKVRQDDRLGPIFDTAVGDHWDVHHSKLCDFWSSVVRKTDRYKGTPLAVHFALPDIEASDFDIWLTLFRQTARELFEVDLADYFITKAENIAKSLILGLGVLRSPDGVPPVRQS